MATKIFCDECQSEIQGSYIRTAPGTLIGDRTYLAETDICRTCVLDMLAVRKALEQIEQMYQDLHSMQEKEKGHPFVSIGRPFYRQAPLTQGPDWSR